MANLTNKTSRSNRNQRRTHWVIKAPNLIECSHCHALRLSHQVCPSCGFYKGKQVIKSKE